MIDRALGNVVAESSVDHRYQICLSSKRKSCFQPKATGMNIHEKYQPQNIFFYTNCWLILLGGRCKLLLTIGYHCPCWWCADFQRETAVPLNLTKHPSAFSLSFDTTNSRGMSAEDITLRKVLGNSKDHFAEMMCSVWDVHSVGKELKYPSCKMKKIVGISGTVFLPRGADSVCSAPLLPKPPDMQGPRSQFWSAGANHRSGPICSIK